jgi:hypothetical protein
MNIIPMLFEGERKNTSTVYSICVTLRNGTKTNNTEVGETILKYHTFTDYEGFSTHNVQVCTSVDIENKGNIMKNKLNFFIVI